MTAATLAVPPSVSLSASPDPVYEGRDLIATATLSRALANPVIIRLNLRFDGFFLDGSDIGTVQDIGILAGTTSGTGRVEILKDRQDERNQRQYLIMALGSLPSSVSVGSPSSVLVTIRDDDRVGRARALDLGGVT